ncbi:MAG: DUF362 domain-containing protein [Chitinophagaceae bacterium]|nr:DUF362 domain-containing protein [Chitinophagaceae bacterium]
MPGMPNGFVKIQTLFSEKTERTVAALQKLYADHEFLLAVTRDLSAGVLEESSLKGKRILLKPNWVKHTFNPQDHLCLCTHDNFLVAVLELVLSKKPASVIIGDAPIQGCYWDRLITMELVNKVEALSVKYNIPVSIKDFRRVVFDTVSNKVEVERNPMSEYIIFDVGKKSYLEPITSKGKNLFRVTQYDPDKFTETHQPGMHKYCIARELFHSDVVISLPKIKTHQKTGITCALKNIVGLNGDKDFLPHHRIGGAQMGGDSYPGKNRLRYWSELALDNANRNKGKITYWLWQRFSTLLWLLSFPKKQHQLNAAWSGNDTTWRMVMDLNMVIGFGKEDGTLADAPQRFLYSFCDGIIGGQGDGPLWPDPLGLGIVCFTDDSASTDICMAMLMGMKVEKIPLLMAAKSFMPNRKVTIHLNGKPVEQQDLLPYAIKATPSPGWENYE